MYYAALLTLTELSSAILHYAIDIIEICVRDVDASSATCRREAVVWAHRHMAMCRRWAVVQTISTVFSRCKRAHVANFIRSSYFTVISSWVVNDRALGIKPRLTQRTLGLFITIFPLKLDFRSGFSVSDNR